MAVKEAVNAGSVGVSADDLAAVVDRGGFGPASRQWIIDSGVNPMAVKEAMFDGGAMRDLRQIRPDDLT